ncbi:ssDNA-binding protein [Microbacterium phage Phinky]|nr:ssDNA-binding protein [Microbacterium phage Phinky]
MNQQQEAWIRQPREVPTQIAYAHTLGRGMLTFEQVAELVKAINTAYVDRKQGKMSYLAQHQARAEMNRIFGYGNWDLVESEPTLLYEEEKQSNGTKYIACYRMTVTVEVRDLWGMPVCTVTGTHAEANANLPDRSEAHAMAITSVSSYAMRRALINLGDRFGLGLYNGGSVAAHGQYTMQLEPGVLFDWQQGNPSAPQAAAPQQLSHETIKAEPVISDDGTIPEQPQPQPGDNPGGWPGQPQQAQQPQPTPQGNGTVADLQGAAAQQQQGRQEWQQQHGYAPQVQQAPQQQAYVPPQQQMQFDQNMLGRLQQGFKQDAPQQEGA